MRRYSAIRTEGSAGGRTFSREQLRAELKRQLEENQATLAHLQSEQELMMSRCNQAIAQREALPPWDGTLPLSAERKHVMREEQAAFQAIVPVLKRYRTIERTIQRLERQLGNLGEATKP